MFVHKALTVCLYASIYLCLFRTIPFSFRWLFYLDTFREIWQLYTNLYYRMYTSVWCVYMLSHPPKTKHSKYEGTDLHQICADVAMHSHHHMSQYPVPQAFLDVQPPNSWMVNSQACKSYIILLGIHMRKGIRPDIWGEPTGCCYSPTVGIPSGREDTSFLQCLPWIWNDSKHAK